jgi:hypothetical protein
MFTAGIIMPCLYKVIGMTTTTLPVARVSTNACTMKSDATLQEFEQSIEVDSLP